MKIINLITGMIVLSLILILTSCNDTGSNPAGQVISNFMAITPSDNSQEIGLNQRISVQFAAPVDKKLIESNFFLISQKDISDSSCPQNKNMSHSDMNQAMIDTSLMSHLRKVHCIKGTFTWNSDGTKFEFKSDSLLEPNMQYMMYMDAELITYVKSVMSSNDMMTGSMGMMNCDCGNKGLNNTTIVTHFKTGNK